MPSLPCLHSRAMVHIANRSNCLSFFTTLFNLRLYFQSNEKTITIQTRIEDDSYYHTNESYQSEEGDGVAQNNHAENSIFRNQTSSYTTENINGHRIVFFVSPECYELPFAKENANQWGLHRKRWCRSFSNTLCFIYHNENCSSTW